LNRLRNPKKKEARPVPNKSSDPGSGTGGGGGEVVTVGVVVGIGVELGLGVGELSPVSIKKNGMAARKIRGHFGMPPLATKISPQSQTVP